MRATGRNWLSSSAAGRMNSSLLRSEPIAIFLMIGSSRAGGEALDVARGDGGVVDDDAGRLDAGPARQPRRRRRPRRRPPWPAPRCRRAGRTVRRSSRRPAGVAGRAEGMGAATPRSLPAADLRRCRRPRRRRVVAPSSAGSSSLGIGCRRSLVHAVRHRFAAGVDLVVALDLVPGVDLLLVDARARAVSGSSSAGEAPRRRRRRSRRGPRCWARSWCSVRGWSLLPSGLPGPTRAPERTPSAARPLRASQAEVHRGIPPVEWGTAGAGDTPLHERAPRWAAPGPQTTTLNGRDFACPLTTRLPTWASPRPAATRSALPSTRCPA